MTFKTELANYREAIAQSPDDQTRALILTVLDRWRDHPEMESVWRTLDEASAANSTPMPPAGLFIAWVLRTRLDLERLKTVIDESPALEAKLKAQANRLWKDERTGEAAIKMLGAQAFAADKMAVLGREQKGAPQKRFIKMWRDTLIQNCGKPLDKVVATLAEIAFGSEVSVDVVRGTQRPTKRQARVTRPPK